MFLIACAWALLLTRISFVNYTNCSINNGKKRREPNGERQLIFLLVLLSIHPVLHSTITNISQITDFALEVLCYTYFELLKWYFWHVLYIYIKPDIIQTKAAAIYRYYKDKWCMHILPFTRYVLFSFTVKYYLSRVF